MRKIPQPGIYLIRCRPTKKVYVGSSANIPRRWREHRSSLNRNANGSHLLQRAWNKHGPSAFEWVVLEAVDDPTQMIDREQAWLDFYRAYDRRYGYNIRSVADRNVGWSHSPETRALLRARTIAYAKAHPRPKLPPKPKPPKTPEQIARAAANRARNHAHIGRLNAKTYIITYPDGREETVHSLRAWCKARGVRYVGMIKVVHGVLRYHQGMHVREIGQPTPERFDPASRYLSAAGDYIVTFPDGREECIRNLSQWCRDNGVTYQSAMAVVIGSKGRVHGFHFRRPDQPPPAAYDPEWRHKGKAYIVTHPDGREERVQNLSAWCRARGIRPAAPRLLLSGYQNRLFGMHFRPAGAPPPAAYDMTRNHTGNAREFVLIRTDGSTERIRNLAAWCREHGVSESAARLSYQKRRPMPDGCQVWRAADHDTRSTAEE